MKKQKMSLERMKSVLSNVLSRDEMKEVMAGSGGNGSCGMFCTNQWGGFEPCFIHTPTGNCIGCYKLCS